MPGLYFAGAGTRPGVGVPMVLISGRLAARAVWRVAGLTDLQAAAEPGGRGCPFGPRRPGPAGGRGAPETLTAAYERCRQLNYRHGTSYYLATQLLPGWKRPHVHALYGFARYADEIVDAMDPG